MINGEFEPVSIINLPPGQPDKNKLLDWFQKTLQTIRGEKRNKGWLISMETYLNTRKITERLSQSNGGVWIPLSGIVTDEPTVQVWRQLTIDREDLN